MNPGMPAPLDQKFDLDEIGKRNADFLVTYIKLSFSAPGTEPDPEMAQALPKKLIQALTDQAALLSEVKRLYGVLEGFKRGHMPLPGDPGAPVLCTGCSLHGARVLWPCETYKGADSALPERKP
jgi:hypothetical protein